MNRSKRNENKIRNILVESVISFRAIRMQFAQIFFYCSLHRSRSLCVSLSSFFCLSIFRIEQFE